ncbi:MAG TPA: TrkH family potassium uptake protein, partial [Proteobacteria bacterium]|nr:TrkH family potassium uptake protein [Pseudomonadota bacterium]
FVGGCAGSTAGALKTARVHIVLKSLVVDLRKLVHPHGVYKLRYGDRVVEQETVRSIYSFLILYLLFFVAATAGLAATGLDLKSAASATATLMGNIGPGLGSVGPASTYVHLAVPAKLIAILCMIAGRLELYPVLLLFFPEFLRSCAS